MKCVCFCQVYRYGVFTKEIYHSQCHCQPLSYRFNEAARLKPAWLRTCQAASLFPDLNTGSPATILSESRYPHNLLRGSVEDCEDKVSIDESADWSFPSRYSPATALCICLCIFPRTGLVRPLRYSQKAVQRSWKSLLPITYSYNPIKGRGDFGDEILVTQKRGTNSEVPLDLLPRSSCHAGIFLVFDSACKGGHKFQPCGNSQWLVA